MGVFAAFSGGKIFSGFPGFSAPAERGARTAAGGFALTGRLLFCTDCAGCSNCVCVFAPDGRLLSLHRLCEVLELRQRVRPDGAAPFLHRLSGAHELRQRVRPNGRLLSLHRLSGGRELPLAGSPLTGGEFSAEPQRGGFAVCGRRGRCGARRGGKKEGTPAVSLPL